MNGQETNKPTWEETLANLPEGQGLPEAKPEATSDIPPQPETPTEEPTQEPQAQPEATPEVQPEQKVAQPKYDSQIEMLAKAYNVTPEQLMAHLTKQADEQAAKMKGMTPEQYAEFKQMETRLNQFEAMQVEAKIDAIAAKFQTSTGLSEDKVIEFGQSLVAKYGEGILNMSAEDWENHYWAQNRKAYEEKVIQNYLAQQQTRANMATPNVHSNTPTVQTPPQLDQEALIAQIIEDNKKNGTWR